MVGEEFDVMLPFGKEAREEARREFRLNLWSRRLFTLMLVFLSAGIILNSVAFTFNNTEIWLIATLLLSAGFWSGITLLAIVGKWG